MNSACVYPSLKYHILVHAHINAHEIVKNLDAQLKTAFTEWDQVCTDININIPVYGMADAKGLYCITQQWQWDYRRKLFLLLKCI